MGGGGGAKSDVELEGGGCGAGDAEGKVIVVHPRFGSAAWCSGRTRGRGEGMSGGLGSGCSYAVVSWSATGSCDLRFVRR